MDCNGQRFRGGSNKNCIGLTAVKLRHPSSEWRNILGVTPSIGSIVLNKEISFLLKIRIHIVYLVEFSIKFYNKSKKNWSKFEK
jgi:hypothetical protein